MTELIVKINRRVLDDEIKFREKFVHIGERMLTDRICLPERSMCIPERKLSGPIRIFGHSFAALAPELVSGPTANPGITTCVIYWTTNVPAYHRVRYKEGIGGAWQYTAWSIVPSTNASVRLSVLTPEHTLHYYDIQSCLVGDGSAAFDWYPGDDSKYFSTLCNFPFVMSNFNAYKAGFGFIVWLVFEWDTNYNMSNADARWNFEGGGWHYLGPETSGGTHHEVEDYSFSFNDGDYYWQARNKNRCMQQGDYSATQHFVIFDGNIVI